MREVCFNGISKRRSRFFWPAYSLSEPGCSFTRYKRLCLPPASQSARTDSSYNSAKFLRTNRRIPSAIFDYPNGSFGWGFILTIARAAFVKRFVLILGVKLNFIN